MITMVDNNLFDEVYLDKKFSFKRVFQAIVAAGAMAIALLILIWILEYFNPTKENIVLFHLNEFFIYNWYFIAGFVLIIGIWDYLYKIFSTTKIRYFAPFFDALSTFFAVWIIAIILNGLRLFIETDNFLNIFLRFLYDLFYQQTILLFLLLILVFYSKFFLKDRYY